MRSVVAVVEARPETILDDYRRVFDLAGLAPREDAWRLVVDGTPGAHGRVTTPPWQLAAALERGAASAPCEVFAVGNPDEASWGSVLAKAGAGLATSDAWGPRRMRPVERLAALEEALPDVPTVPEGLVGKPVMILATAGVGGGWPVTAGLALLQRLLAPRQRRRCRATGAEIVTDVLALARQAFSLEGVAVDGTLWRVQAGRSGEETLQGNVLLAGADPVAVDAVACRLAGGDPARVPWLRLCAERGLGQADPRQIRVRGHDELSDLGFGLPPRLLVAGGRRLGGLAGPAHRWNNWLRPRKMVGLLPWARRPRSTVWDRLRMDFRTGEEC